MTFSLIDMYTFRFHSSSSENRPGFQIEYSTIALFTDCGGDYTKESGILTSPSYPNPYPHLAECIYLISQPIGTYVNASFITMDVKCHETYSTSDYIEMRDGNSEDSPVMGRFCGKGSNVLTVMQTTQNYLRIR